MGRDCLALVSGYYQTVIITERRERARGRGEGPGEGRMRETKRKKIVKKEKRRYRQILL